MSVVKRYRKLFLGSVGAAVLAASGCGSDNRPTAAPATTASAAADGSSVTLVESAHDLGPWSHRLSLRLGRDGVPVQFYVCAVHSKEPPAEPCAARTADRLPSGTTLRLEQRPPGPGAVLPDSPGWGLVGTAEDGFMKTVLSDFVSANNKPGTITYRVTQRDPSGRIVATSNRVVVTWHQ